MPGGAAGGERGLSAAALVTVEVTRRSAMSGVAGDGHGSGTILEASERHHQPPAGSRLLLLLSTEAAAGDGEAGGAAEAVTGVEVWPALEPDEAAVETVTAVAVETVTVVAAAVAGAEVAAVTSVEAVAVAVTAGRVLGGGGGGRGASVTRGRSRQDESGDVWRRGAGGASRDNQTAQIVHQNKTRQSPKI